LAFPAFSLARVDYTLDSSTRGQVVGQFEGVAAIPRLRDRHVAA
jgi:hypothetical protein